VAERLFSEAGAPAAAWAPPVAPDATAVSDASSPEAP
jgi:hypothetical protein